MIGLGFDEKSVDPTILNNTILLPAKVALGGDSRRSRRLFGISDPHEREYTVQGDA